MGGSRNIAIGLGAAFLAAAALLALLLRPADAQAIQQTGGDPRGNYVGVATCGGTTCHGRSNGDGPRVRQDEVMLWQDPATAAGAHSRAFAVLREPRSRAIAERLGLGEATGAPMCLGCHATPGGARGIRFQTTDGVGCESCHGPAGGWLSSHYTVGGTHQANVRNGLVPLDNPRVRAETCLNCHFGSARDGQFVNHRIMAAGTRGSVSSSTSSPRSSSITRSTTIIAPAASGPPTEPRSGRSARRSRSSARSICSPPTAAARVSSPNSISSTATAATGRFRTIRASGRTGRPIRAGRSRRACRPTMTRT